MNAKTAHTAKRLSFAVIAALFAGSAFAGQPAGRDSFYAEASASFPSAHAAAASAPSREGRASVYASELPAPTPHGNVNVVVAVKPGRA